MGALILKSGNSLQADVSPILFTAYKNRVLADGGFIADEQATIDAFNFAELQRLSASEVFSATSASWGVKKAGDKPAKLYSLFESAGDINIGYIAADKIFYNTTRYSNPVIELKNDDRTTLQSIGTTGTVSNYGLCVVTRTPVLDAGTDYTTNPTYSVAELSDVSPSDTAAISVLKRAHLYALRRANSSVMPSGWYHQFLGHNGDNTLGTASTLVGADDWGHVASFVKDGRGVFFNDGTILAQTSSASVNSQYNTGLTFNIGRGKRSATDGSLGAAMYGDIAEAWCLVNTTEEKMKALSTRAAEVYPN